MTFTPHIDTYENKVALLALFGYTVDNDMVETPCKDIVSYDEIWAWLVRNGVSMDSSYQRNMAVYLEHFGFTRTSYSHKRNVILDVLEREVTQKRALLAADLARRAGINGPRMLIINAKHVYVATTQFSI